MLKRHRRIEKTRVPIEEIISTTQINEDTVRRDLWIEGLVLALPLVVSFAFYVNLIFKATGQAATAQLSPSDNVQSLVFFVFAFIIIYSIFLIFEYGNIRKKLKEKKGKNIYLKK